MSDDLDGHLRPFNQAADLAPVSDFVGECNALTDGCAGLHLGDVAHHLSNGLRGADPAAYLQLYESAPGRIDALVVLYPPRFAGYNLVLHPARRDGDLEARLLAWSEQRTWAMLQATGSDRRDVGTDVMDCDTIRQDCLRQAGYTPAGEPYMAYTTRALAEPIPESVLLPGFQIRPAAGAHEAAALGEVHAGAFNSAWPGDAYRAVMRSPAYRVDRELVVVAPDGRFAAFLIYWLDPISRSALFEPVGCHKDFQRQGLTRALMYEGLRRMRAAGMATAIVLHERANAAATALYTAVGFRPRYLITDYRKPMVPAG